MKRVGDSIYLSPYADIVEENSGIFTVNNKKYKIVLMAKVLNKKKSEFVDQIFLNINDEDTLIYNILVKEEKNDIILKINN